MADTTVREKHTRQAQLPVDQFGEPIKGVSLWLDAWRRLKRNRMALVGLGIVVAYGLVSLLASVLPIHSFKHQVLDHQYLPPSFTKNAGQLLYEKQEKMFQQAVKDAGLEAAPPAPAGGFTPS